MWPFLATIVSSLLATVPAWAGDAPVVQIRDGQLHPPGLEVHVGEIVRWQAPPGQSIRVQLDDHPSAHEVAERAGDVYAIFRKPGRHSYVVTIRSTGDQVRGTVTVGEAARRPPRDLDCAAGSSDRVCFVP